MASFYVHRARGSADAGDHQQGWVGPISSRHQAAREVAAWIAAGWRAVAMQSTPELRRRVATWQAEADARLGRARAG